MTGMLRVVAAVTSVVVLGFGQPAGWADVLQGYRAALGRAGIVGSSLMIVRDGRIVARANEGLQDREAGAPVTDDTIYHWASITKTFTGIAIMKVANPMPFFTCRAGFSRAKRAAFS